MKRLPVVILAVCVGLTAAIWSRYHQHQSVAQAARQAAWEQKLKAERQAELQRDHDRETGVAVPGLAQAALPPQETEPITAAASQDPIVKPAASVSTPPSVATAPRTVQQPQISG